MTTITKGTLVRMKPQPGWRVGKVIRIRGDKADVFFDKRSDNMALPVVVRLLEVCEEQSHPRLDNLPEFEEREGKLYIPEGRMTHEQAVRPYRRFLRR